MVISTEAFVEPLERWAKAIHEDDFAAARRQAERLLLAGELLVAHPSFRGCFAQYYPDLDPEEALVHVCRFLLCATDGRARAQSQKVKDRSPSCSAPDALPPAL